MNSTWKWVLGLLVVLVVLGFGLTGFMMGPWFGYGGYGMMRGWHMPMMQYGGYGMMGGGYGGYGVMAVGMLLSVLIQLGVLVLIVMAIVWAWRVINRQENKT